MARHRQDDEQETQAQAILPETVEQLAAAERAGARRPPRRRLVIPAVVGLVLASIGGAWVLSRQSDRLGLVPPSAEGTATGSYAAVEGFGQASEDPSPSSSRLSPRVSPSRSLPASPEPRVPALGVPLAHYRFDESSGGTAEDASGGGRTAALAGGAAFVPGRLGNAIALGGSDEYVALPAGILGGATDFTFAAWVRLDSAGTWSRVFDFGSNTSVNMFLTARSDAGTARFAITTGGNGKEQRINAPAPLPTGTWTHVAVTLSGGVGVLYVNRAEVARTKELSLTPASLGDTARNWIGRSQYQVDPYLDGIVDDVRIYARALPASEIAALP